MTRVHDGAAETVEGHYFATRSPEALERERLDALGRAIDPITRRHLAGRGLAPGWHCLEVGAGDGGVARWMAERVGPGGRVVAADVDTRLLGGPAPFEVRRLDILADDPEPAAFDLVHSRMVLQHLPDPRRALDRMAWAVRPGGWLVVEESDWASCRAAEPDHPRASDYDCQTRAVLDGIRRGGALDLDFGRRVRGLVEALGFEDVGHEGTSRVTRGGEPGARFARLTLGLTRGPLVAAGVLPADDYDAMVRAYDDPSFGFVDMTLFAAWGRRPLR